MMAKYDVTYACGHKVFDALQLFGPDNERQRRLAWERQQLCPECRRANALAEARAFAAAEGLPALVGSDKQIAWAETIRHQTITLVETTLTRAGVDLDERLSVPEAWAIGAETVSARELVAALRGQDTAKWWIDHAKDVTRAGKPVKLGRYYETELGMLTVQEFVVETLWTAIGVPKPTLNEMAKSGNVRLMARAAIGGV